jgi:hypothetical protein
VNITFNYTGTTGSQFKIEGVDTPAGEAFLPMIDCVTGLTCML